MRVKNTRGQLANQYTVYREVPGTSSSRNLAIIMEDILRPPTDKRKGHVLNSPTRRDPSFLGPGADVAVGTLIKTESTLRTKPYTEKLLTESECRE